MEDDSNSNCVLNPKNINQLPNDCLILILNHCDLSLTELIILRSVCSHWNQIIRTICRAKRSLKLFGSVYSMLWYYSTVMKLQEPEIDFNTERIKDVVQFRGSSREAARFIPDLFPNLKKLFYFCAPNQIRLDEMLERMPNCLTSLTLWGDPANTDDFEMLWTGIHTQHGTLEELYLMDMEWLDIPEDCTIMSCFKVLGIKGHHGYQLDQILTRIGPQCKEVQLEQVRCIEVTWQNMINGQQANYLTHLTIDSIDHCSKKKAKSYLNTICTKFQALQYFYPKFASELQLDEIQTELTRLPSLTSLRLFTNCTKLQFPYQKPIKTISSLLIDNYQFQSFIYKRKKLELLQVVANLFNGPNSALKDLLIRYQYPFESPNARGLFRKTLLDKLKPGDLEKLLPGLQNYKLQLDDSITD